MTPNPDLEAHRTRVFPIEELADLVEALAGESSADSANAANPTSVGGRARPLSPRGVRWYQSLGLIDAPRRVENRRSLYEFRHLLQLLAIRLAQARGASIEELQRAGIAQIPTDELELALDELMDEGTRTSPTSAPPPSQVGQRSSLVAAAQAGEAAGRFARRAPKASMSRWSDESLRAEPVGCGAVLLLDPAQVDDADRLVAAVRRAVKQRSRVHLAEHVARPDTSCASLLDLLSRARSDSVEATIVETDAKEPASSDATGKTSRRPSHRLSSEPAPVRIKRTKKNP